MTFERFIEGDEPAAHNQARPKDQRERRRQFRLRTDAGVQLFGMAVDLRAENQRMHSYQGEERHFYPKGGTAIEPDRLRPYEQQARRYHKHKTHSLPRPELIPDI